MEGRLQIFSGNANRPLAQEIASYLNTSHDLLQPDVELPESFDHLDLERADARVAPIGTELA